MNDENKSVFMADGVIIGGPRADGNYRVSFDVGEYQYNNIKNLPLLNGKVLVVAVVQGEDLKKKGGDNPAPHRENELGGVKKIDE